MIRRSVVYSPAARNDLKAIYDQIVEAASNDVADGFLDRVLDYIDGFEIASERGSQRPDLRKNLRVIGFERTLTICFAADAEVRILRVFHAGRDWPSEF